VSVAVPKVQGKFVFDSIENCEMRLWVEKFVAGIKNLIAAYVESDSQFGQKWKGHKI